MGSRRDMPRPTDDDAVSVPDDTDALGIGQSFDDLADALRDRPTPYPWCYGAPTRADCLAVSYCRRNPSCGD